MTFEQISTSPSKYIVLDVETNGLRSKEHDLLSLSLFKPDDGKTYDRFLPLDLNDAVCTTEINGIRDSDLKGTRHLSQSDVDLLFKEFELDRRTILHYGNLDPKFVRNYFTRHRLNGFEQMHFFNFKQLICSTRYSDGSLTKDNLCNFFGIEGVSNVHSGANDCRLEWELFKKIDGRYLLARIVQHGHHLGMWRLSILNPDYILPVSYLSTYANLSRSIKRPYICCETEEVFHLVIEGDCIRRFPSNFSGMTIEHLINTMLDVSNANNVEFLTENSAKNQFLGYMPSSSVIIPMAFNDDGTVAALRDKDDELAQDLNATTNQIRKGLFPLVKFIRESIFHNKPITSQELIVDESLGILALCDLSSEEAILEIKTSSGNLQQYAEQLYYEASGRIAYLLSMEWGHEQLALVIRRVNTFPGLKPDRRRDRALKSLEAALSGKSIHVVEYTSSTSPVLVRCQECNHEWIEKCEHIRRGSCICPKCHPEQIGKRRTRRSSKEETQQEKRKLTPEQALFRRASRYAEKVLARSNGSLQIDVSAYAGARDTVSVHCIVCDYRWTTRADHLLTRCYCPKCAKTARRTKRRLP